MFSINTKYFVFSSTYLHNVFIVNNKDFLRFLRFSFFFFPVTHILSFSAFKVNIFLSWYHSPLELRYINSDYLFGLGGGWGQWSEYKTNQSRDGLGLGKTGGDKAH